MGTSFEEIYCLNNLVKSDKQILKMDEHEYYAICWKYLQFAISYFSYSCNPAEGKTIPKVLDYLPYQEQYYEFEGNGIDNQFQLSPAPIENCKLYIVYKLEPEEGKEAEYIHLKDEEFIYDPLTQILTLGIDVTKLTELLVWTYVIGEFVDVLDIREKHILAEGMTVPFLEQTTNSDTLRTQMIYNSSAAIHSQANHQDANIKGEQHRQNVVDKLITQYSYSSNRHQFDKLSGKVIR